MKMKMSPTETDATFMTLARGYSLCHDRSIAEQVILRRMRNYQYTTKPEVAAIPLVSCDFTGEIGNIIVELSNRCATAEQNLKEAHNEIRALRSLAEQAAVHSALREG
jgi:hypothetical protein